MLGLLTGLDVVMLLLPRAASLALLLIFSLLAPGYIHAAATTGANETTAAAASAAIPAPSAFATTDTLKSVQADLTAALAEAQKLAASEEDGGPGHEATDLLQQAQAQLKLRDEAASQTQANQKDVREAPAMLDRVKQEIARDDAGATQTDMAALPTTASAEVAAQWLEQRRAELASLQERQKELAAEQGRKAERLAAIPKEMLEVRRQFNEAQFSANAADGLDNPLLALARKILARATMQAAAARAQALESEQARLNAREELVPLGQQLLSERIAQRETALSSQTELLNELRRQEASVSAREIKQAAREANTSHPLLRAAAAENSSITEELNLSQIVDRHEDTVKKLEEVNQEAARIAEQETALKSKFQAIGYSDAMGILLRKQRNELPNVRTYREALAGQETLLAELNLKGFEIQEKLNDLGDPAGRARELLASEAIDASTTEGAAVKRDLVNLLQARKDYLAKARDLYDQYFRSLLDLNTAEGELVRTVSSYADFIDERILWLPSANRISGEGVAIAGQTLKHWLSPDFWKDYASRLRGRIAAMPIVSTLALLLLLLLVLSRRYCKKQLHHLLTSAQKNRLAMFWPVGRTIMYTAMLVAPLPLAMVCLGLPLAYRFDVPGEVASMGAGLLRGGMSLFVLLFAVHLLRRKDVAETFFVWQDVNLARLRHSLTLLGWIYIPTVVVVRAAQAWTAESGYELARLALIVTLIAAAVAFGLLLRPGKTVLANTEAYRERTWLYRLRYVLFAAVCLLPILLAAAALMGYVYTAIELAQRVHVTFWLGAGLLLLNEIIFFWILVKRRRLAIAEARKRREAIKSQADNDSASAPAELPAAAAEPQIDISAISQQAGRLLHVFILGIFVVGLWLIWSGVLPALRYLDTQALYTVERPVTIADLLLVIFVSMLAVAAIKNIPGLLDITVFQKFKVQAGERYAFNTLMRYVIIIVGLVYVFYKLGLQWKQVQWMAAGVSVGLGFGLQEIFANFVSGLILLFERPVRVGDIVTVGDISGRVSQIRIRATTIVNWDHKEYLIPNKELVTKQVLNWTLNDRVVRLLINVGVNYGADYDKAREILLKIAKENPFTLDDPAPAAAIEKFGPSSVDFFLAVHLPNLDNMTDVRHDMIKRISEQFTAAGISIPFPQMEVHLDPGEKAN